MVFGICLPACIPCGFCAFNQLFMADTPDDYWCRIPELLDLPLEQRKSLAIPKELVSNGVVAAIRVLRLSSRPIDCAFGGVDGQYEGGSMSNREVK